MNLAELEDALNLAVQDNSLVKHYRSWINIAIQELAADLELPALKRLSPATLTVEDTDWLFELPEDFHKMLFRCADSRFIRLRRYRTMSALDRLDLNHDEIGEHVIAVATADTGDNRKIGVYPRANDTLYLWYYFKPSPLVKPTDVPYCIPESFHSRVIIPKATIKAYEHLQDQVENFDPRGLQYWTGKLAAGLNGSPVEGIGLKAFLSKIQGGPRRHGGRDPVGIRFYG